MQLTAGENWARPFLVAKIKHLLTIIMMLLRMGNGNDCSYRPIYSNLNPPPLLLSLLTPPVNFTSFARAHTTTTTHQQTTLHTSTQYSNGLAISQPVVFITMRKLQADEHLTHKEFKEEDSGQHINPKKFNLANHQQVPKFKKRVQRSTRDKPRSPNWLQW